MGLKLAIGGKGGVGKTTVSAIWSTLFSMDGYDVLAIDADPDANLAAAFGVPQDQMPVALVEMKDLIKQRTGSSDSPGAYFKLNPHVSDLPDKYAIKVNGLKVLTLGALKVAGKGCACPESAFLKALLCFTILQRKEVIIVDLDAGVECMGRATVAGIDAFVVVVEPGARSIDTAMNIIKMAHELDIKYVAVIANKITEPAQVETIKTALGQYPVIGILNYESRLQQADLQRKNVFDASEKTVDELKAAKNALLTMINGKT